MGYVVDVEADEEVVLGDVASLRVDLSKVEGRVSCGGVWSACTEDAIANGFDVRDPRAWVAGHEEFVGLCVGVYAV